MLPRYTEPLLRGIAIVIALAAVVDPALSRQHAGKPEISVIAGDPHRDSALAARVASALEQSFTVIRGPFPTDATVIAGTQSPSIRELSSPVFVATPARRGPSVTVEAVRAPTAAPFEGRVPVVSAVHVVGARGRTVDVTLQSGALAVDHATHPIASDDERITIPLGFIATSVGATPLTVIASVNGATSRSRADASVTVRATRWSVLFYDPRPSWMATFVKRAIERDRRFLVTSRVVTSRNLSTDAGLPPARLDDLDATSHFDAIIIGAPESLTEGDVAGLDAYLRRRGGSAVLLLDERAATPSAPYDRLLDVGAWSTKSLGTGFGIAPAASDSAALRAAEVAWPNRLPAGAELLARALPIATDSARNRAVIWRSPVGAGRLVVSGALDAWRFRDPAQSDFDRFWQRTIADVASASPAPLTIVSSASVLAPGEEADVAVIVRSAMLRSGTSSASAITASAAVLAPASQGDARTALRLWPSGGIGELHATLRAPRAPGVYRIVASADQATTEVPIVVANTAVHAAPDADDLLAAWAAAHGGRVISESEPQALTAGLLAALHPASRVTRQHPMRSAWWIVPFSLALSAEWWLRRRRGLP